MNRLMILQILSVMLYAGPVIAGLSGFGWNVAPAFVLVFVAWQVVMRPDSWPREPARWREPGVIAGAALQVMVTVVLVTVCFGAGRGLGGVFGYLPQLPLAVPLLLSLASVPLARMLWDPVKSAQMDALLDDAIHKLKAFDQDVAFPSPDAQHILDATALAGRLLQPVQDLPDDTPPAVIGQHLRAIATQVDDGRLREALLERAEGAGASRALLTGLAWHATDGRLMEILGTETAEPAFAALGEDAEMLALYATRAVAAVTQDEDVRDALPRPHLVEAVLARLRGTPAEVPLQSLLAQSALRVDPVL